jgi:hypothetical protein
MKRVLILLLFFIITAPTYAVGECSARIINNDTYTDGVNTYPQAKIQVINAGVDGEDFYSINSAGYTIEHTTCPVGYTLETIDTKNIKCIKLPGSGDIGLTELQSIKVAYSGSGGSYGDEETGIIPPDNQGAGSNNFTDPGNVYVLDNQSAVGALLGSGSISQSYSFPAFNIPTGSKIKSIQITVRGRRDNTSPGGQLALYLTKNGFITAQGNTVGNDLTWLNPPTSLTDHTYITNDTYTGFVNYGWTADDFQDFQIQVNGNANVATNFYVDYIEVKIAYEMFGYNCFTASIDTVSCGNYIGTMCPDFSTLGSVDTETCLPLDYYCLIRQWMSRTINYWLIFDTDTASDGFSSLFQYAQSKPLFAIPTAIINSFDNLEPLGDPDYKYANVNLSIIPKYKVGGVMTDLNPVHFESSGSANVAGIQPFMETIRLFFIVTLTITCAIYMFNTLSEIFA